MSEPCLIPGCDGFFHDDDTCVTDVAEIKLDGQGKLCAELVAQAGAQPHVVTYTFDLVGSDEILSRLTDPADVRTMASEYRAFADSLDLAAALLAMPQEGTAKPAPVDHAARFAALDSDFLFELETAEDTSAPHAYIESLLIVLADWQGHLAGLLADAPAWSIPEVAAYERALSRTREAYMQWSFRWLGGPVLPESFDLPEPVERVSLTRSNVARIVSAGRRDLTVRQVAA